MITTPVPITLRQPIGLPRSPGLHVSNIIRPMAVEMGVLDEKWVEDMSLTDVSSDVWWESLDEPTRIRMCLGLAWEQWYVTTQLEGVAWQPGEMCVEGVYMTHDGESLDVIITHEIQQWGIVLHEIKTTSKSINTVGDLVTQWMWLAQMKAYCKGLGTTRAYIHVLFLRGDWKFPFHMVVKCWQVDFTQEEIDANWEDLTEYVKHRRAMEQGHAEPSS